MEAKHHKKDKWELVRLDQTRQMDELEGWGREGEETSCCLQSSGPETTEITYPTPHHSLRKSLTLGPTALGCSQPHAGHSLLAQAEI